MRLLFIRHGDPDYDLDVLTELGHEQAKKAARRLLCENIDAVYASTHGRAWQTAEAFTELSGISPIHELPFMREIRYGKEEALYESGHPWNTADLMMDEGTDLRSPEWRSREEFIDNTAVVDFDTKVRQADDWLKTLGYEREGLYYRNISPLENTKTVAVFCHGGSATVLLAHILNQEFPYMCAAVHMGHTAISILRFDKRPGTLAMPIIELLNDCGHTRD